jgi:hypothetical protein
MKKFFALALVSASLIGGMVSCGSTPGPKGDIGLTGPTGPTGPQGPAGLSDVRYSPWFTDPTASAENNTTDGTCLRRRTINRPDLTADVINKSMIVVYFRVGSIGPYALPYISDAGGATNQIGFTLDFVGKLRVFRHTFNSCRFDSGVAASYVGEPVMVNLPSSLEYRYVIIPGTVALAGAGAKTDWKSMPYEQIKAQFNIPD